jgi:hypothetical protein
MKYVLPAILLILLWQGTNGQNKVDLGFRAGVSTSKLYTNLSDYNPDNIIGYQAGMFMRFFIKKAILFEPEAYFVKKGGDLFNSLNSEIQVELNTLDVPLLFGFKILDLDFTRLLIYTGPVMSFQYSDNSTIEYSDGSPDDPFGFASDMLKKTNWAYQLGGSFDLFIFTLDVRYEWGLNDIYQGDEVFRPNVFLIGLGVRIF